MKVKIFNDKTTVIRKGMIEYDTNVVVLPKSIKEIEEGSLVTNDAECTFCYAGTKAEFEKIEKGSCPANLGTPCVYCEDGLAILAL